ncbi:hypothetical protein GCM10011506_21880 [Marivirga lumbricoides]|uniref:1,4-beta-xylanase n=1 Tax=Marivirga lumbricoides TaxID=1046115 RepID=A0ABQ1MB31_9BACT|nr:hypothetical protein GCM10011506_21880 [Marivirga lumbricoides]
MRSYKISLLIGLAVLIFHNCTSPEKKEQNSKVNVSEKPSLTVWSKEKANKWYKEQPWLVGANYNTRTSINQLEMWQANTFDTAIINQELGWAADLGMNTMRVYLHDLLWQQDSTGLVERMGIFLKIADKHHIKPLFVLFDSCWDPYPEAGKQRVPQPHLHNSGWVQSPGLKALKDTTQHPRLERYVKGVVMAFAEDKRVLGWDIWNEPDNTNDRAYGKVELENKAEYVLPLLKKSFVWARESQPIQPITSGVWIGDWSTHEAMTPLQRVQIEQSDVISFHNYDDPAEFKKRIKWLQRYERPLLCTEYMARPNGSTFQGFLPIAKELNIAMYNWGFVDGKTQTKYPWDSWDKVYTTAPEVWFHEVLRADGMPYKEEEVALIKELTDVEAVP